MSKRARLRLAATSTAFAFLLSLLAPTVAMARKPPTGTVEIFSFVKGATVEVNGRKVGTLPLKTPLKLKAGNYTLRVFKRGYTEFTETITVVRGKSQELEVDLIPFAGIVKIKANIKGATVAIDGKLAGTVPFDKDVPAGDHEITVQAKGYKPFVRKVDIKAGRAMRLDVQLAAVEIKPRPNGPTVVKDDGVHTKWWFWTIIGVVVAGGATAGALLATQGEEITPKADFSVQFP